MRHRTLPLLLACASLFAALPAAAEVYTIKLTNGTIFQSRYQPVQAAWDASMLFFLDETGLAIALPQAIVIDVSADSETKGYGMVINTTTVDLGFMPNDVDQNAQRMAQEASSNPFQERMNQTYDQKQFVEPSAVGGGIPVGFGGGGYGGGGPAAGVPFSAPANNATPAGFAPPAPPTTPAMAPPATTTPPAEKPPQ